MTKGVGGMNAMAVAEKIDHLTDEITALNRARAILEMDAELRAYASTIERIADEKLSERTALIAKMRAAII